MYVCNRTSAAQFARCIAKSLKVPCWKRYDESTVYNYTRVAKYTLCDVRSMSRIDPAMALPVTHLARLLLMFCVRHLLECLAPRLVFIN